MSTPDTNLSSADTPASAAGPVSAAAHQSVMQTMIVLIRREFWEHRALWMAPLVIAVLLVACAFPIHIGPMHITAEQGLWSSDSNRLALFGLTQWGLTLPQYLVMAIVLNFYRLDCLYVERKDRSILFWKSMPVSDAATVASKLLTALVVVPLGVYLLTVVTNLLFSVILITRGSLGGAPGLSAWDTVVWLKAEALVLYGVIVSAFWYAPMAAYLVLVSAWARRSVFLWATLPPLFAIIVERLAFGTHYVTGLIEYRTWGIWKAINPGHSLERTMTHGDHHILSLAGVFDTLNVSGPFLNIDLWLGL